MYFHLTDRDIGGAGRRAAGSFRSIWSALPGVPTKFELDQLLAGHFRHSGGSPRRAISRRSMRSRGLSRFPPWRCRSTHRLRASRLYRFTVYLLSRRISCVRDHSLHSGESPRRAISRKSARSLGSSWTSSDRYRSTHRLLAWTYRGDTSGDPTDEAEADPKEFFVYHAAGQDGAGSYVDDLILRDRDAVQPGTNTDPADTWSFASDGTLEERVFLCQSWRADVVLVLDAAGAVLQRAWYSPYGVPTGADAADVSGDGATNTIDYLKFQNWYSASDARADWNLDGSFTSQDTSAYLNDYSAALTFGGRGVLTSVDLDIRIGYAGYRWDQELDKYHVRHRVYDPYSGRWINRDPIEYAARVLNLYEYVADMPVAFVDPMGLQIQPTLEPLISGGGGGGGTITSAPSRDTFHTVLDVCGMCPGLGEPADGLNAVAYLGEGKYGDAAFSACCMLPFVDWVLKPGKWIWKGVRGTRRVLKPVDGIIDDGIKIVPPPAKGKPKPPQDWISPTNPPQLPPAALPPGHTIRDMPDSDLYPDGYWIQYNQHGQPVDPSTGKPPSNCTKAEARARTHVPKPPKDLPNG